MGRARERRRAVGTLKRRDRRRRPACGGGGGGSRSGSRSGRGSSGTRRGGMINIRALLDGGRDTATPCCASFESASRRRRGRCGLHLSPLLLLMLVLALSYGSGLALAVTLALAWEMARGAVVVRVRGSSHAVGNGAVSLGTTSWRISSSGSSITSIIMIIMFALTFAFAFAFAISISISISVVSISRESDRCHQGTVAGQSRVVSIVLDYGLFLAVRQPGCVDPLAVVLVLGILAVRDEAQLVAPPSAAAKVPRLDTNVALGHDAVMGLVHTRE